jgi:Iap family predicted aminopeptidase
VAATDGLIALRAGYPTCTLGGIDETKFPSNYHWPSDTPDNLSWESVEGAVRVCEAYVRAAAYPGPRTVGVEPPPPPPPPDEGGDDPAVGVLD